MLERKEKNTEKNEREGEKYYQRNGYASKEVERLRAKRKWINVELNERDKDTDKQERREGIKKSRYNRKYERCMTKEICSIWGERECKREKNERDLDVGTRIEKTGIGWKDRKGGAECAIKRERQLSTCGMDVAK
ncbi:hypothetical protein MTP99_004469 [Tenebrio molitor]|jgi:hypothetical protein|nr:hypothetical protein MTP99_004469 [Tenebrio molitor]